MERTMSVEEKIRRAEEIYARRQQGNSKQEINRQVATVSVNNKKDIKLLKKMLIQILISITIYFIIYAINNNSFPFSKDFINNAKEILSYDTNFAEVYENIKKTVVDWTNKNEEIIPPEESIGGAEESNAENSEEQKENVSDTNNEDKQEEVKQNLSQEEQDIINAKNTTTYIKPLEGIISSKYGHRDTATGTVPKNHTGTDIAANQGTKIKAATDGEVVLSSEEGDYRKTFKNSNWRSKYCIRTL